MEKITIIIPCYNSEKSIGIVVNDIIENIAAKYDYEIILSNDGSKDKVWQVIETLCKKNERIKGICLSKNYGQQSARMAALNYVTGDYVVFMDDDGQHPVDGIEQLIAKCRDGYDIVYAYFKEKQEGLFRIVGSEFNQKTMEWLLGKPKEIKLSSFFVAKRFVVEALRVYNSPVPVVNGYFMQITKNIANVELEHRERTFGKSGYNIIKLAKLWMNNITGFSIQPLKLASILGIIMSVGSFLWSIFLIVRKMINPDILIGYTSILVVILFCSGIIMLLLGIIGEYIGRIYMAENNLPQYVVRETLNLKNVDDRDI